VPSSHGGSPGFKSPTAHHPSIRRSAGDGTSSFFWFIRLESTLSHAHQRGRTHRSAPTKMQCSLLGSGSDLINYLYGKKRIRHSGPRSGIHAFIPDSITPQRGRTHRSAPTKMQCSLLGSGSDLINYLYGKKRIRHSGPRSGIHAFIPDSITPQRGRTHRSAPTKCNAFFRSQVRVGPRQLPDLKE
jgi:hypothetical protein